MFNLLKSRELREQGSRRLYNATSDSVHFLQRLKLEKRLCVHDGCVNTICWNDQGNLILSGSDDQHLAITDPFTGKSVVKFRSGHRSNIFSAKFLPGSMDREVVSCSGSGEIFYTDVDREDTYGTNRFDCHFGTTYKLLVVPNEAATFLSCGDDGTVRFFDLRTKTSCSKFNCEEDVVVHLRNAVTAMAVDPVIPFHLAVASSDGIVRLYDRRMLKTRETGGGGDSLICKFSPPMTGGEKRHYRITSLNYRPGAHDVLVNYSSENIYMFNTYDTNRHQSYSSRPQSEPSGSTSKPVSMVGPSQASMGGAGPSDGATSGAGAPAASADNGSDSESAFKPIKRLRLRGDWSDTGPDARPESEEPALTNTIMQRMSDLLTRMLNSRGDQSGSAEGEEEEEGATGDNTGDEEMATSDTGVRDETVTSSTNEAAAMLRSVMFRSASAAAVRSLGNQARQPARFSISSEGLVSPELSSQDMDAGSQGEQPGVENEAQAQNEAQEDVQNLSAQCDNKCSLSTTQCKDMALSVVEAGPSVDNVSDVAVTEEKMIGEQVPSENEVAIEVDLNQEEAEVNQTAAFSLSLPTCEAETTENVVLENPVGQLHFTSELESNDRECDMNVDVDCDELKESNVQASPAGGSGNSEVTAAEQRSDRECDINSQRVSAIESSQTWDSSPIDEKTSCDRSNEIGEMHTSMDQNIESGSARGEVSENSRSVEMEVDDGVACPHPEDSELKPFVSTFENTMDVDKQLPAPLPTQTVPAHSSLESNSESNDSISEQMSTNLHIKQTQLGAVIHTVEKPSQSPDENPQFKETNLASLPTEQLSDLKSQSPDENSQSNEINQVSLPTEQLSDLKPGPSIDPAVLPGTSSGFTGVSDPGNSQEFNPSHISVLKSQIPIPQGPPMTFNTPDSSSSWSPSNVTTLMSWSDSPVAVADGALSSYEGSNSQRTLNDVAHFSSLPNLSTRPSLTEITPTAPYSCGTAKNPSKSCGGSNTSAYASVALLDQGVSSNKQSSFQDELLSGSHYSPLPSSDSFKCDRMESSGNTAECSVTEKSSVTPLSEDASSLPVETAVPAKRRNERDSDNIPVELSAPGFGSEQTSKAVLGFFTSETSEVIETAMVIPKVCNNCQGEFAIKMEDADCLQGQERLRTGLCPPCFRKKQEKLSLNERGGQVEVANTLITDRKPCQQPLQESHENTDRLSHDGATVSEPTLENVQEKEQTSAAVPVSKGKIDKGKGIGKSSLRAKQAEAKSASFAPYNSGKMRISSESSPEAVCNDPALPVTDIPMADGSAGSCEGSGLSTQALSSSNDPQTPEGTSTSNQPGSTSSSVKSLRGHENRDEQQAPESSERHRRVGYSLPPTGNFQLYGDDDDDSEDDTDRAPYKRKMISDKERIRQAAQKIQEIYRKKREAREQAKMMDVPQPRVLMKYSGHRNCRTMIKEANFYGDHYVMSGSDCGRILAWERETGRMVMYMDADRHVVNCVQPNLYVPVLASSGIDYDIKIWSPLHEDSQFDDEKAEMIIRRNELMLEETRDTVTVPAAFMLRILASLSQIRTGRNTGRGQQNQEPSSQE